METGMDRARAGWIIDEAMVAEPYQGPLRPSVTDLQTARLQRDVDELRAEVNNLAHRLNEAISNLQSQIYDKVNA